ncbi:hypothetical protein Tco_0936568 [Tanacetum coccineum]
MVAVMSNGPSKQLCIERFPQLASVSHITEPSHNSEPASSEATEHVYASLYRALTEFPETNCIANPVSASSTDNYPEESIINTLESGDKIQHRASYWSSQGSDDPETPETLIYQLKDKLCVITEINLHPFKAFFQMHFPVYSSRFVRFRMGHPKSWIEMDQNFMRTQECADYKFVWTYTSEMFPVAQENLLQRFKLPEPVVCIGGYLQIELLGRVQKQEMDGKYYICVAHVQVIGRQLSPAFCIEFSEQSDTISLKYDSEAFELTMQNAQNA